MDKSAFSFDNIQSQEVQMSAELSQVKSVSLVVLRHDRAWDHKEGDHNNQILSYGLNRSEDANWVIVAMFQAMEQL